jgi:soluble cytochrome b562
MVKLNWKILLALTVGVSVAVATMAVLPTAERDDPCAVYYMRSLQMHASIMSGQYDQVEKSAKNGNIEQTIAAINAVKRLSDQWRVITPPPSQQDLHDKYTAAVKRYREAATLLVEAYRQNDRGKLQEATEAKREGKKLLKESMKLIRGDK